MCLSQSPRETNLKAASPYTVTSSCWNAAFPLVAVPEEVADSVGVGAAADGGGEIGGHCAVRFAGRGADEGACGVMGDHDGALTEVLVEVYVRAGGVMGDHAGGARVEGPWPAAETNSSMTNLAFAFC